MEWFKHDVNCLMDDRLSSLVQRFSANGYAVYFCAIEALYANEGQAIGTLALKRIAKEFGISLDTVVEICEYAASDDCDHLLHKVEDGYASERVCKAIQEKDEVSRKKKENARKRWDKYISNKNLSSIAEPSEPIDKQYKCNATAMQVHNNCNATAMQVSTEKNREDICNNSPSQGEVLCVPDKDNCGSSPSQEEVLQPTVINEQKESTIVSSFSPEPEKSDSTAKEGKAEDGPVFIEIQALQGKKVKVFESKVEKWQQAFPGISVKEEILRASAWLDDNPTKRKTAGGMNRYLFNWLSRSQNRAARSGGIQSSDYIKGTDIRMTARAVGSDPSRYDKNMTFDDMYEQYMADKRQGGRR